MARSAEKAVTALARFRKMKLEEGKVVERRPYLATHCNSLRKCEKWRRQIIGEVSRKVSQIQNAGLPDFQLRDLNDEINKLMREKLHWEERIIELGGPNYKKIGPKMLDHDGKEVPGNRGYKYFGAAKDLPGVRELFQKDAPKKAQKTRGQLMKFIDADYYGYRDEDDGVIVPLERELEETVVAEAVREWKEAEPLKEEEDSDIYSQVKTETTEDGEEIFQFREVETQEGARPFVAHVPVPSQQDVEDALLRRKKRELLEQYASEALQAQSAEAKTLMGL
uniref:Pre-mRNA-splicing factor ISY1 homolog n=1 Tax=Phallusia mammillata TaxID=59560 RepID=A0A6F9DFL0_9ASCI|nr:pre-mRNA-splicing factor ISY1 homolog [Phallusia mammillata]